MTPRGSSLTVATDTEIQMTNKALQCLRLHILLSNY